MLMSILMFILMFAIGIALLVKAKNVARFFSNIGRVGETVEVGDFGVNIVRGVGALVIAFSILSTSFVYIPKGQTGHLVKKLGGKSLPSGRIIATNGELGRQADILPEGLHFKPLLNIMYDVEKMPNIVVPTGKVGLITTRDGQPLDDYVSEDWTKIVLKKDPSEVSEKQKEEIYKKMLDARYFLEHGGKKGPQLNVLKPGEYRLNRYLYSVTVVPAVTVPAGFVGVVTSRAGKEYKKEEISTGTDKLATPVVPKGYRGVWKEVLLPGSYYEYSNRNAYKVTLFDTRVKTWPYKGGFVSREIEVYLTPDGKVAQKETEHFVKVPKGVADKAIDIKSKDGWVIFAEARLQVQAEPKYTPYIVASVGTLEDVENKVITPIFRSILRNIGENKKAVEFLNHRSEIEKEADRLLKAEAIKAGVTIKDLRISHINIPPALLVPKKRKQLAEQMRETYKEEQKAYREQVLANKTKAEAEQQFKLVEAQIEKERAKELKEQKRLLGEGEKLYLEAIAKGQKAQVDVLGPEKTYGLQMWKETIEFLGKHPEVAKNVPAVYINKSGDGSDGSFDEGAAIFSIQQIKKAMESIVKDPVKNQGKGSR